jgi:hypothetical protein
VGRFTELYSAAVRRRGGDPEIGLRLPQLLARAGFAGIGAQLAQPGGLGSDVKELLSLTFSYIRESLIADGLAAAEELEHVAAALGVLERDPLTLVGLPRVAQVWGQRAA